MIAIDTHIWVWWVAEPTKLSQAQQQALQEHENDLIGISAISCWEIAKLVQGGRLDLQRPVQEWFRLALGYPGVQLLPLTPVIATRSTQLEDGFRSDPADELIIATALSFNCPLLTRDQKIRNYGHVQTI